MKNLLILLYLTLQQRKIYTNCIVCTVIGNNLKIELYCVKCENTSSLTTSYNEQTCGVYSTYAIYQFKICRKTIHSHESDIIGP